MKLSNFAIGSSGDLNAWGFFRFFNHTLFNHIMTRSQNHPIRL
jgi:hypothetical protein